MNPSSPSPGTLWREIPRSPPPGARLATADCAGATIELRPPWRAWRNWRVEAKSAAPPGDLIVRLALSPTGLSGALSIQEQPESLGLSWLASGLSDTLPAPMAA